MQIESETQLLQMQFYTQGNAMQILHDSCLLAEPEGQLLNIQGSTPNDVAASIDRVLQILRIRSSESKVKSVAFHFPRQIFSHGSFSISCPSLTSVPGMTVPVIYGSTFRMSHL